MIPVGMMQVPIHQIVHVVAVRHGLVPASGAMLVACLVGTAPVIGGAVSRVRTADRQLVFIHVVRVGMMEMAIVQVVGMPLVAHGLVTAVCPVHVSVTLVRIARHEGSPPVAIAAATMAV